MNNWDKYRRMQCNVDKATLNDTVAILTMEHYKQLYNMLVKQPEDRDIFNDTYLKLTYKYNPNKDFIEQFKWIFNQLKGAYYRDAKCNIYYQLEDERLNIPDCITDVEAANTKDTDIINNLKAILNV